MYISLFHEILAREIQTTHPYSDAVFTKLGDLARLTLVRKLSAAVMIALPLPGAAQSGRAEAEARRQSHRHPKDGEHEPGRGGAGQVS
jgi:predicted NBD/HSP70 family sugar kinase